MYGLADCNNFFVSCERVFNPSLIGKPVVVLSNNDGCVISRSDEAKALGIKMGEPVFKIKDLAEKKGVISYSANFALYGDLSARIMNRLKSFAPSIEIYSIDEAFLNFDGMSYEAIKATGEEIVRKIKRETGIPISLGISRTKTLAKVAAKLSKKYPKLNSLCLMDREEDIKKVLLKFPVEDIWGVGRAYSKMLKSNGINTASDFTSISQGWVKSKMGIVGLKSWRELNGEPCIEFEDRVSDKKQICTSRSFSEDIYEFEEICKAVATFTASSAEKLRRQKGVCREIIVFILTNRFKEQANQHYESTLIPIENYTDSTFELVERACSGLKKIYKPGYGYKKAGVIITDICRKADITPSLFHERDRSKESSVMTVMDEMNTRYGRHTVFTATEGVEKIRANQNFLSKRFTTSWDDIIEVKV
jgi:DNA polymerase V